MQPSERSPEAANFRNLVLDIAWFGIALPATTRFLSVYAIRLGATPLQLGLLAAMPAVGMFIASAYAQWWLRRFPDSVRALSWPALLFRFAFLLPALAPFLPPAWQPVWIILAVALPALPQGIAAVIFIIMMRESVPPQRVTPLISTRMMAMNITLGVSALLCGMWLKNAPFPMNYQAMYIFAFMATLVSWRHCNQVRVIVPSEKQAVEEPKRKMRELWSYPPFVNVAWVIIVTHIGFFAAFPLIPLHMVENMGVAEDFMAIFAVVELGAAALISTRTTQIVNRIGNRTMISFAMVGTAAGSLIVALAPIPEVTLIAAALLGASWTAVGVGLFGFFNEQVPVEADKRFSMLYHQTAALGLFIGPLVGSSLVDMKINVAFVLVIGAAMRLIAAWLVSIDIVEFRQSQRWRLSSIISQRHLKHATMQDVRSSRKSEGASD